MKIKLTNYPFEDNPVGTICDFGQEQNASLVSFSRAVWVEEEKKKPEKKVEGSTTSRQEKSPETEKEKVVKVEQVEASEPMEKVEEVEKVDTGKVETETPTPQEEKVVESVKQTKSETKKKQSSKASFWDKLK